MLEKRIKEHVDKCVIDGCTFCSELTCPFGEPLHGCNECPACCGLTLYHPFGPVGKVPENTFEHFDDFVFDRFIVFSAQVTPCPDGFARISFTLTDEGMRHWENMLKKMPDSSIEECISDILEWGKLRIDESL